MLFINPVFAADDVDLSTLPNPAKNITGNTIADLLSKNLLNLIFVIIGLIFAFNIIMSGWDYMLSSGDPKKVSAATTRFTNNFIGIIIAIAAFLIVRIITTALGLGKLV